jgi:hypothetical protein
MRTWNDLDGGWGRRAARSGVLPLIAAITSALALTGVAFYTVDRATCGDPAQYIRHDNHVELVGGCVDSSELVRLRSTQPNASGQISGEIAEYNSYRP